MPTDEERSFNEAMNEWAAKQSFFQNPRNRIIHPDPSLPWPFRMLGYLLRVLVVLLICSGVFLYAMKKYLSGQGFAEMMAEKLGTVLQAEDYEGRRYVWKGNRATTKLFSATGSETAFFKELDASSIAFTMPKSALFRKAWKLDDLNIANLDMTLRVGRSTELSGDGPALPALVGAGFGIDPNLKRVRFDRMEIADADLRWGVSSTTRGSIIGAPLDIVPETWGWTFRFTGGKLSQNWWRGLSIESLEVQVRDGQLLFSDAGFKLAGKGEADLTGAISLGPVPEVDLQMSLGEASLTNLVPAEYRRFLGGRANATVAISGSPNTRSGLEADATLEFLDAKLRNIPAFEALSLLLESTRIRHLPLTSGSVEFETSGGEWRVTDLNATCGGIGTLRGSFTVSAVEEPDPEGLPPTADDKGETEAEPLPIEERYVFSGKLRFGVPSTTIEAAQPSAKMFFTDDGSGTSWIEIPLDGPITELTRALHSKIIANLQR